MVCKAVVARVTLLHFAVTSTSILTLLQDWNLEVCGGAVGHSFTNKIASEPMLVVRCYICSTYQ